MHRETAELDEGKRLLENIGQLHTTQMGLIRIRKIWDQMPETWSVSARV